MGIKDSLIVVVGTDECTYYTKSMTIHSEKFGGIGGRCVSVVLDDHDVTFGSAEKVQEAFKEIIEEYRPQCVFLVTTCVIEIIGDDFDAISEGLMSFMVFRCCRFILSILNVRTICLVWNERLLFVLK
ncbi:MAG: nitrogenase component 1 [Phascolarctobacterium faecium]